MIHSKDIAIVILNWNGVLLLEKFLPSVVAFSEDAAIYLADNASTDQSVAYVSEAFPSVKIIENFENLGYSKGYNTALKKVKQPVLCLLNNDVDVTKNWLQPIIDVFNSDDTIAIAQPKILDYNNKTYFEYAGAAGGFIDKFGYPFCRGRIFDTIEKDEGQYDETVEVFWASGACFFIKNEVFQVLNGFDEQYFAHMEEIDLCWRAFNHKYKTYYVGNSVVYHVGGATLSHLSPQKTYLNFRNSLFTLMKNTDTHLIFRVFIRMLLDGVAAIRFLFQLKPQHFLAILKAHCTFYSNLRRILKQRSKFPKRKGYFTTNSIVWRYFVLNNRKF